MHESSLKALYLCLNQSLPTKITNLQYIYIVVVIGVCGGELPYTILERKKKKQKKNFKDTHFEFEVRKKTSLSFRFANVCMQCVSFCIFFLFWWLLLLRVFFLGGGWGVSKSLHKVEFSSNK